MKEPCFYGSCDAEAVKVIIVVRWPYLDKIIESYPHCEIHGSHAYYCADRLILSNVNYKYHSISVEQFSIMYIEHVHST